SLLPKLRSLGRRVESSFSKETMQPALISRFDAALFESILLRKLMTPNDARCICFSFALLTLVPVRMLGGTSFFNDWASAHMSDVAAESGQSGDPDHDGQSNLVEFAFGTDTRSPASLLGALNVP